MFRESNIKSIKNVPTIRREDPVAKFIGMKPNDICKIEIFTPNSGKYTKYRRCTLN